MIVFSFMFSVAVIEAIAEKTFLDFERYFGLLTSTLLFSELKYCILF